MNISGEEQWKAREDEFRTALPTAYQMIQEWAVNVRRTGAAQGLSAGDRAPDFTLHDALGEQIRLYDQTAKGPVVLTFYRGSWCPFCNLQLKAFQEALPRFREFGASLVAVSPQSPDGSLSREQIERLGYVVASDPEGKVCLDYKLLYEISGPLREMYADLNIHLDRINAGGSWVLPVSATFIVDRNHVVRFAHVDPDFTRKVDPEDVLQALAGL